MDALTVTLGTSDDLLKLGRVAALISTCSLLHLHIPHVLSSFQLLSDQFVTTFRKSHVLVFLCVLIWQCLWIYRVWRFFEYIVPIVTVLEVLIKVILKEIFSVRLFALGVVHGSIRNIGLMIGTQFIFAEVVELVYGFVSGRHFLLIIVQDTIVHIWNKVKATSISVIRMIVSVTILGSCDQLVLMRLGCIREITRCRNIVCGCIRHVGVLAPMNRRCFDYGIVLNLITLLIILFRSFTAN